MARVADYLAEDGMKMKGYKSRVFGTSSDSSSTMIDSDRDEGIGHEKR